jgi:hypothetical protein
VPFAPPRRPPDDATVPTTPSPSVMIANGLNRSATWCGCHGVPPARPWLSAGSTNSRTAGSVNAANTSTVGSRTSANATHPTWRTTVKRMFAMPARWNSGDSRAARRHCATIAIRITT